MRLWQRWCVGLLAAVCALLWFGGAAYLSLSLVLAGALCVGRLGLDLLRVRMGEGDQQRLQDTIARTREELKAKGFKD
jgi:hypothetical protein